MGYLGTYFGPLSAAGRTVYVSTPVSPGGLAAVYATDEDVADRAGQDFKALCPKWQLIARGSDGVFSAGSPWTLTSASCDLAAVGVAPGHVVILTLSSANLTGDLFGVDSVAANAVTLHRLSQPPGVGMPPGRGGLTGVGFEVRTFGRQIDDASFDLNGIFGIDPDLPYLSPVVLQRPRELRRLAVLSVLKQAYAAAWQEKGDDWSKKLELAEAEWDDVRARVVLHLQSLTGTGGGAGQVVRPIGVRIGR